MDFKETEPSKYPLEHIIMSFAFAIQERGNKLAFDELLFLRDAVLEEIEKHDRELHWNENQELGDQEQRKFGAMIVYGNIFYMTHY